MNLKFFDHEHLPAALAAVASQCRDLALIMAQLVPPGAEREHGLRKLLEAKDCFVRATLFVDEGVSGGDHEGEL